TFRFINGKNESLFLQKKKAAKFDWTVVFRRLHKKGVTEEVSKKKSKRTVKVQRAVVGATLDSIKAKRNQKPEAREAQRKEKIAEIKQKKKQEQEKKKAEKTKATKALPKGQKVSKQQMKGAAPKVAAKSR
ncbi:60S ribosomal protein L24, partial [Nowakowskiella sp. JEL0078]